ncbi:MAG: hypothetical protein ABS36_14165 [Acidobacteria bacterium SCN 69-37]|nr:MAG: hypothetical protein ABS36_14165 [Acidobacteria bacterium SCN 69-37]
MSDTLQLTRRAFLATTTAVPLARAVASAQARTTRVGLQLYSVRGAYERDWMATVRSVATMGYQAVEFWAPYMQWSNARAQQARQLLDDLGITCPSTHNPATSISGDALQRAIELNQALGSRAIIVASPPPKMETADAWKAFAEACTQACETLRPLGMTAGFHNHAAEWREIEGQRPMDILAAGTPRDFILQLDVGTCVQAGADPVAWITAHPGRIRSMHCKDWGAGDGRGYRVAFGEGDAPWRQIFQAAETVGGIEQYYLEQEIAGALGELGMVQKCLDRFRALRA